MSGPSTWIIAVVLAPLLLLLVLVSSLVLFVSSADAQCNPATSGPAATVDPKTVPKGPIAGYSGEQLVNAATIMVAIKDLNMNRHDQQLAVMTAIGESSLQVLDHGDGAGPDSRGLFQQRDNGAWGTYAQRMDPYKSAQAFGRALKQISDRHTLEPTIAVHRVQRNSDPHHYQPYWAPAGKIVTALADVKPAAKTQLVNNPKANQTEYALGPSQPATIALANTIGPMFKLKDIGGFRAGDMDHGKGLALDFMTYQDTATGNRLAAYLQANAEQLSVKYVIWQQRIWNAGYRADEGWRPMADRGSTTQNHMDHVHLSLTDGADPINGAPAAECANETGSVTAGGWAKPVKSELTDTYGWRNHPILKTRKFHYGLDLSGGCNEPIFAASGGTVTSAATSGGYGHLIEIDHGNKIHSRYAHMYASGLMVRAGDKVRAGQQIAKIGSDGLSSGCHLHFEITNDGDHIDPYPFLTAALKT